MSNGILPKSLFSFLRKLKRNNNRDWFAEHKQLYQQNVLGPAVELVARLEKPLARCAPMLHVSAKAHNGSVLRIYRDTRFGKDKTPYKTNVGISLRHQAGKDVHAPGIYLHLEPAECFIGAGTWRPESSALASIRAAIDADPKAWKRARDNKAFRADYEFVGESLKTAPRDYPKDHPLIEDLRRKDFVAIAPLSEAELTGDAIVDLIIQRVKQARPLMRFLCDSIGVPY
ncbi:hypothetical protein Enr13x_77500 [Stieleria neptunia]|uniref:TIGR02453 family protein n=1 Tax=Stieleria neptunia TaxID=2527979 RepID=A0A518I479_9BACT|nr:DUF2461 domain-containing protein [Stieleria neptunia]QDV47838.1 hypothetical protein Enr13x_77500 [Stieleria neptunia]